MRNNIIHNIQLYNFNGTPWEMYYRQKLDRSNLSPNIIPIWRS